MSLVTNIAALATRIGAEFKTVYGTIGSLSALDTTDKTDIVSAINEALSTAENGGAALSTHEALTTNVHGIADTALLATKLYADGAADAAESAANTYSDGLASNYDPAGSAASAETNAKAYADTAVSNLVDSAPSALDTLNELAAALGDDASFSTTISTSLGNRVRVDAEQTFNTTQQAQARYNISAASSADLSALSTAVGDTTTNYVTTFEAALA